MLWFENFKIFCYYLFVEIVADLNKSAQIEQKIRTKKTKLTNQMILKTLSKTILPEEAVRQKLLHLMTTQLGYPKELLVVEKQLSELPHLKSQTALPKRRADIICFGREINPEYSLAPLLLIECKEGDWSKEAEAQALGYNHYVRAHFVALAGKKRVELIYPERVPFLPTYSELLERAYSWKPHYLMLR